MAQNIVKPESFSDIFAIHSLGSPCNETVHLLDSDIPAQLQVVGELGRLKQTRFINLVKHQDESRIAISLYAGNGIVTKITPEGYLALESMPFVLFPFAQTRTQGTDRSGIFAIENFPCLQVSQSESDVSKMRSMLAACGLHFTEQDDRPGNIGILADGSLAILDGNAVRVGDVDQRVFLQHQKAWQDKIKRLYTKLYVPLATYQQSPSTDYTIKPYKPGPAVSFDPAVPEALRARSVFRPRWFARSQPVVGAAP